jgi:rifampin ADP-ribosyltransferase
MSDPAAPSTSAHPGARRFYHGTRADLEPGDLIRPGYASNYTERRSPWVYFSETLDAAIWGAELAKGPGPGHIYVVESTGPFMDDPNLTDRKYPGNPTKSYRSREPLRVVGECLDWQGHSPEVIQAMKDGIAGLQPIDD